MFAPSDLRQYDYAFNSRSGIVSRYPKGPDPADACAAALVKQDLLPLDPATSNEPPPKKKQKVPKVKVWPKKESKHVLMYKPDKSPDDDAAPSMG